MRTALRSIVGIVLVASSTSAADRRIEGVVKAIDSEKSTITLTTRAGAAAKDEALDVVKKAKITVNGKPASLGDVRRGQKAVATFYTELEVVTKLDTTGEGVAPLAPEITVVNELPETDVDHTGPWLSADGMTLYWKTRPRTGGGQSWIWTARRKAKDGLFEDAKRLVPGSDMTVSADGLEMILLQGDSLWVTTRPSPDATFVRPRKLAEFQDQGFLAVPCLSGADLILYGDRFFKNQPVAPVKSTRASRKAKWGTPAPVKVAFPAGKRARFFSVTPDGSRAFCALFDPDPQNAGGGPPRTTSVLATMRAEGDGFGKPQVITINGEPLIGIFPRYVAATNELFFVRQEEGKAAEIALVRNFDPDAIATAPASATAKPAPARPDRQILQGHWVSVSETIAGNPLTPQQLQDMNKRVEVRGDKLLIRRTGLGGRFGVYDGTFRLDPSASPRRFDWSGKDPEGAPLTLQGIYQLDGDTFRVCWTRATPDTKRPDRLESPSGSRNTLLVLKRDRRP